MYLQWWEKNPKQHLKYYIFIIHPQTNVCSIKQKPALCCGFVMFIAYRRGGVICNLSVDLCLSLLIFPVPPYGESPDMCLPQFVVLVLLLSDATNLIQKPKNPCDK